MAPHPILMHILYDDRSREVEAILTSQQQDEQRDVALAPVLAAWQSLTIRILTSLRLASGHRIRTADEGTPPLPC